MNKIIKNIAAVLPMLAFVTACTETNDWTVDSSINRQPSLSTFEVTPDTAELTMAVKFEKQKSASGYEIQISTDSLKEGFDESTNYAGLKTIKVDKDNTGSVDIDYGTDDDQYPWVENTTYYMRIRSISDSKDKSKWYTSGIMGDVKSVKMTPMFTVSGLDISVDEITLHWIKKYKSGTPALLNMTDAEGNDSIITLSPDEKEEGTTTVTGLVGGATYTFQLLDADGKVLGTTTVATEKTPNMEKALSIFGMPNFIKTTAGSVQPYADSTGTFVAKFIDKDGKFKMETNKSTAYFNPVKEVFKTGDMESDKAGYRMNTGGKAGEIDMTIPAKGRLYVYTYVGSGNAGRNIIFTKGKVQLLKQEVPSAKTGNAYAFTKVNVEAGTVVITWDASIYIQGFQFVPDDPDEE